MKKKSSPLKKAISETKKDMLDCGIIGEDDPILERINHQIFHLVCSINKLNEILEKEFNFGRDDG